MSKVGEVNGTWVEREKLIRFFADSLELWEINGEVRAGQGAVVAEVRAANGALIWIERAPEELPFRWQVRWRAAGEAPGGVRELRPKACSSLVGVLAAMRESGSSALGLLRLVTDQGIEGHAFLGSASNSAATDGRGLITHLKPVLMGRDPMHREAIVADLWKKVRASGVRTIGADQSNRQAG